MKKRKSKGKSKHNREDLTMDGSLESSAVVVTRRRWWWLGWARRGGMVDGSLELYGGWVFGA
jgi:hypothetical protein